MRLEDQRTFESVESSLRMDPWSAEGFTLVDYPDLHCLLIGGARAVVAVDASTLAWRSSVSLEYQEAETLDEPWHVEAPSARAVIVATERRVWCVETKGLVRWMWSCRTTDEDRWVKAAPVVAGDRARVPLRTSRSGATDVFATLDLVDGLPTDDRAG